MRIANLRAVPVSFPVPAEKSVRLGIGRSVKRDSVLGFDAHDVAGVWARVYKMQLASHGMGAAAALALSGIDLALWDIKCQLTGWTLYRLLGGQSKPIKAYA